MRRGWCKRARSRVLAAGVGWISLAFCSPVLAEPAQGAIPDVSARAPVSALGRLEPKDGVIRVAGPSRPSVVIADLLVDEGDRVEEGQVIALLDTVALHRAETSRLQAELANARAELLRHEKLHANRVVSDSTREQRELAVRVASAELRRAEAELDLDHVRAPVAGRVLEVHARAGERVGADGILELGRTDAMYAIAEVYETDVVRVLVGQHATVESPALPGPLHGIVEKVGLKVGRLELVDSDPQSRVDARVVEVEVRLDESKLAEALTNLQVEVRIDP